MTLVASLCRRVGRREVSVVADAAVIGLPHADWGEQVHAVVEIRRDAEATEKALIDYCKGKLSKYKVRKTIEFRAMLPLTAYGKLDKKALRKERTGGDQ